MGTLHVVGPELPFPLVLAYTRTEWSRGGGPKGLLTEGSARGKPASGLLVSVHCGTMFLTGNRLYLVRVIGIIKGSAL